jgi:hypothetical protein
MTAVRGRVRGGRVEVETDLPEGTEVVVLTATGDEPFELDEAQVVELEARIAGADRGDVVPASQVLEQLRPTR